MAGRQNFAKLREQVLARPGGVEALAAARVEALEEIRLYDLRHTRR